MSTAISPTAPAAPAASRIEANGVDVIAEDERRGRPRDLFWPWCAGNVQVLSIAWGAYLLDFGISFTQAVIVSLLGAIVSFLLVGAVSLVGMRGSAPTLVLSRAAFGVRGSVLGGLVSYLLLVGWETVQTSVAVLASGSIAERLGIGFGGATQVVVFALIVVVVMALGVLGFDAVMRAQKYFTWITLAMTVAYIALTLGHVNWTALAAHPDGSPAAVIGAAIMVFCGFGVGWTSAAADYSRYLPRGSSRGGIVGWTTFGGALPIVLLIGYGLLLCGSDADLSAKLASDPIGALTDVVPAWFIVPFWIVAVAGMIAGCVLDIYSSGLALVAIGLPLKRWQAAFLDGVLVVLGTIYVVWFAPNFLIPFQGFLITLGVPLAAWTGVFAADVIAVRWRRGYDERKLFDASASGYGSVRWPAVLVMIAASVVGWGLVTNNSADWLTWQGYLLGPLGGKEGPWAFSSIGVLVALVLAFAAYLPFANHDRR